MALASDPALDLSEEAGLEFELGVADYQRRAYPQALEHLLASNRLVPNRNVVYNIARTYEQLGKFPQAFRHYSDYRAVETDPARRAAADEAIVRIRPRVALVRVESDPPGARIYVDREDLGARGEAPRLLALEPGSHTLILQHERYYEARATNVSAVIGQEASVTLQLEPVLGTVTLSGKPAGASVRVDAEDAAVAAELPASLKLSPGSHMLIVSAPGYRTARQLVQVSEDGEVPAVVELPLITGTLLVDALEKGALIEIDGQAAGFTPAVLPAVPAGAHTLRVSLPGYRAFEQEIELSADGRVAVTASLRPIQEVTAASRQTQAVEDAPASVTLISAEEIRAFGYQSLYDALGGTRGIYQSNDRVYEYLGVRGFSRQGDYGNRLLTTLDGHSLNDDQLGASYVGSDFAPDLMDVERIEMVRGPGSALYGSSAFFGVLNVVTRERESVRPSHVSLAATTPAAARVRANASGTMGDGAGWWVSADGLVAQGEPPELPVAVQTTADDAAWVDQSEAAGARGKLWSGAWTAEVYGNYRHKRIPTGAFETIPGDPRAHSDDGRAFAELRFEPEVTEATQVFTRVYVDRYQFEGEYPYDDDGDDYSVKDSWRGTWLGAEARVAAVPAKWFRVTGGVAGDAHVQAELQGRDDGAAYLDEAPVYQTAAVYTVVEADAGRALTASAGARLDWFSSVGATVNPRAALILRPAENHTVKLLAGRAFRAPSPYELFYNDDGVSQVAPTSLDPETVLTGEVEYTTRFGEVGSLVSSVYYAQIDSLISLEERSDGLLVYANADEAVQTAGVEVEARRDWRGGWMVALAQSVQQARQGDLLSGAPLTNSPQYLASLKAAAPLLPGQVNGASRLRFETGRLDTDGEMTEPSLLWDVTLTGAVPSLRLDWALGVRNVLDWQVSWPAGDDGYGATVQQVGRSAYAEATVGF